MLNRAEKLIQELRSIVVDLNWYGIKLELTGEKLSAEPKNSADSEKYLFFTSF